MTWCRCTPEMKPGRRVYLASAEVAMVVALHAFILGLSVAPSALAAADNRPNIIMVSERYACTYRALT